MDRFAPARLTPARVAELILEHAQDYAVFTLELDGRISSWTKGAERVTGYTAEDAIGLNFAEFFTASDRAAGQPALELQKAWTEGRAEDTRWHLRKDGSRFWANGVTTGFQDADGKGLIKVMRDETRNRIADEQRVLLLNELNHRINNTLVTVQSLVAQTLRGAQTAPGLREDVAARLVALSDAHRLLVTENWAGADLGAVVAKALAPYDRDDAPRLRADGPTVRLSPQQAVSMSLALHELTTNAVKYGALSTPDGHVEASWNLHIDEAGARRMTFLWEERGGPPVATPVRRGFGSRLLARSFGDEVDGQARIDFAPAGVRCTISLSLTTPAENLDLAAVLDPGAI